MHHKRFFVKQLLFTHLPISSISGSLSPCSQYSHFQIPLLEVSPCSCPPGPPAQGHARPPAGGHPLSAPEPSLTCRPCPEGLSRPGTAVEALEDGPAELSLRSPSSGSPASEPSRPRILSLPVFIAAPPLVRVSPPISPQDRELHKPDPWVPSVHPFLRQ